jgi:hypothetical protein
MQWTTTRTQHSTMQQAMGRQSHAEFSSSSKCSILPGTLNITHQALQLIAVVLHPECNFIMHLCSNTLSMLHWCLQWC